MPNVNHASLRKGSQMNVSVFDLFKIGIGPSSSHTVGPMIAACRFASHVEDANLLGFVRRVRVELYGSLGATGKGHGTDKAVLLGLEGHLPDLIDPDLIEPRLKAIRAEKSLALLGKRGIRFDEKDDIGFYRKLMGGTSVVHPNGMRFQAFDEHGQLLVEKEYYSVGGGFVVNRDGDRVNGVRAAADVPYPFRTGEDLMRACRASGLSIAELTFRNECALRPADEVRAGLVAIWKTMAACVERGCKADGELPGPMRVKRRAADLHTRLRNRSEESLRDPLSMLDWVNLYAMAVNEENAAGGRVVTAPTNGAAGVIPAVLHYYVKFVPGSNEQGIVDFLLTAAAIGIIYKETASISGAEVGCQGEGGRRVLDGCGGARRGDGRHPRPGRERGRDRHGAQPRDDVRPRRRPRADSVHRAQRDGRDQGAQRVAHRAEGRRPALRVARFRHQDDARDGRRHEDEIQGNVARRPRRERDRMLTKGPST